MEAKLVKRKRNQQVDIIDDGKRRKLPKSLRLTKRQRAKLKREVSKLFPERDPEDTDFRTPFGGKDYFLP